MAEAVRPRRPVHPRVTGLGECAAASQIAGMIRRFSHGAAALALAVATALLLAACAAPAPSAYGPKAGAGRFGYDAKPLEDGAWQVEFTANQLTPREAVEDYALYRAAEIALKNGFDRFAVIDRVYDRHIQRTYAYNLRPPGFDSFEDRFRGGSTYSDPFSNSRLVTSERRTAVLVIRPFRDAPPDGAGRTYDARAVIDRIGPTLERR